MNRSTIGFVLLGLGLLQSAQATSPCDQASVDRIQWWRDAKFGLFIHWGPVSLVGKEIGWSRAAARPGTKRGAGNEVPLEIYDNLYKKFNPTRFDAAAWVQMAQRAGMKYLVFTTRHHDGFSMWDTQASEYKITAPESPYRRDIVRQLADAAHAGNLRFGTYYSQPDWHHPDAFTPRHANYVAYLHKQLRELMTDYGRVDVLWFDGLGDRVRYRDETAANFGAESIHPVIRALQPNILINNRDGLPEDFDTPEQRVGRMQIDRPWESCITIAQQWAWKPGDVLKSRAEILQLLVTTVTGDGNLLLNVGPQPDGRIEARQVERLDEIGAWLKQNGEAIYGTRGGPWTNGMWGGSTYRANSIYVQLLRPPSGGRIRLAPLPHRLTDARLLDGTIPVKFSQDNHGVILEIEPKSFLDPVTIVKLTTAEPVAPGQQLGSGGELFADELVFGSARQQEASVTAAGGAAQQAADGSWSAVIEKTASPSITFDLGKIRQVTGIYATNAELGTINAHASLVVSLSVDGKRWQEVWRGSYGLPMWEILIAPANPVVGGLGQSGRFIRVDVDYSGRDRKQNYGGTLDSLKLKDVRLYAK